MQGYDGERRGGGGGGGGGNNCCCSCVWFLFFLWCTGMEEASALVLALWWSRVRYVSWVCSTCLCLIMLVVHGYGRGKRLGTCLVVKPCASCIVSLQHMCMHHLRRLPKTARCTRYILVPQKGTEIALLQKAKTTRWIIKKIDKHSPNT